MEPSQVYAAAARRLEDQVGSEYPCIEVGRLSGGILGNWYIPSTLAGQFILAMAPGRRQARDCVKASKAYIEQGGLDDGHSILALCFMAAITGSRR